MKCGHTINSIYSAIDLACNYISIGHYSDADSIFSRLINQVLQESSNDSSLVLYFLDPAIRVKTDLGKWEDVKALINLKRKYNRTAELSSNDYTALANDALLENNQNIAKIYLDSAKNVIIDDYDREIYNRLLKTYSIATKDSELENNINKELLSIEESVKIKKVKHPVFRILNDMTQSHHKEYIENLKAKDDKSFILTLAIFIVVMASGTIIIFIIVREYRKKHREVVSLESELEESVIERERTHKLIIDNEIKLKRSYDQIIALKNKIDDQHEDHNEEIRILSNAIKEEICVIVELCESLPEFEGPKNNIAERALLLKDKIINRFGGPQVDQIFESINLINGGLTSRLKSMCPELRDTSLNLFSLYSIGFSTKGISMFLNVNRNTIDQRKIRLKKAILKLPDADRSAFLKVLYPNRTGVGSKQ